MQDLKLQCIKMTVQLMHIFFLFVSKHLCIEENDCLLYSLTFVNVIHSINSINTKQTLTFLQKGKKEHEARGKK